MNPPTTLTNHNPPATIGCGLNPNPIRREESDTPHLEALGRFCDLYEGGELPEFHDIVDTFIAWSDEILNWHCAGRASNGRIEGTNNLLQVLRRTAHGFTNPTNFEARGILVT